MNPSRVEKSSGRKSRPTRVSLIGAGRMGLALALALHRTKRYVIESIIVHRPRQAASLTPHFPPRTLIFPSAQLRQISDSELVIIATPDVTIQKIAGRLRDVFHERTRRKRIALHLSGALSSDELAELRTIGFAVGSLHPLVSISDSQKGADLLREANYCLEGDGRALQKARALVKALEGESFSLKAHDKILYHAAAVISAGHLVALFDVATELLGRCGLTESNSRRLLLPLAQSTLLNLSSQAPSRALTGPFPRGDSETISRHLEALHSLTDQQPLEIYRALGQRSLQLAVAQGIPHHEAKRIARLLKR